ncbi:MAG TPA: bifunctional precorrin-2 dehydrogenase/sirohydrochlorin ferrochelatase [Terriglobales bacterium]
MSAQQPTLFPIFLKLEGKPCLVVGGGRIAEGKIAGLLRSGARVTVVSPELTAVLATLAESGAMDWKRRNFEIADLDGAFLLVAATSSFDANALIYQEADRHGILCNAVDQPDQCHFYYPAVVDRGPLQIAISTAGLSPSLAQRLRKDLEIQFGPEYEGWVEWLGRVRSALMSRGSDFETRKRILGRLASREVFNRLKSSAERKRHGVAA